MAGLLTIKDIEKCVGCGLCMYACARRKVRKPFIGYDHSGILAVSLSGFERGATIIVCKACPDPPCSQVCPTSALIPRKGGGVVYREKLCTGCDNCIEACTIGAIFKRRDGKVALCIHCGYCASYCPHGVIEYISTKQKVSEKQEVIK